MQNLKPLINYKNIFSLKKKIIIIFGGAGNLGKRRARAAAKDARSRWTAAHCIDSLRRPAAWPLALRANEAKTTGPCPDRPLNPLTGQSSGYGLPSWCWRCFPQPGAGGSSPLRRRTCPPGRIVRAAGVVDCRHHAAALGRACPSVGLL